VKELRERKEGEGRKIRGREGCQHIILGILGSGRFKGAEDTHTLLSWAKFQYNMHHLSCSF